MAVDGKRLGRLEVALSSLGIYYYEVVSPGSGGAGVPRFSASRGGLKNMMFIVFPLVFQ